MLFSHERFTMSFHQALDLGIDYRDFEKVRRLPKGVPLIAIAGVWGEYGDIRCLFMDTEGKGYLRYIQKWGDNGFLIRELGLDAKAIEVGQTVNTNT
ncbi:hypothetical protein [Ruegeria sp. HKCCD7559]|uniref:hypothetical protein n=1 Tax=Ruegeria sp. HKCCD7559 TaxID=2683005 RepID=UPI0014915ADF|nr:hypothetical protein [Ruegeria sp. HKCCD7559]NOC46999.1 hypothetical protein [Ruegeria sp. HKCCD7559]